MKNQQRILSAITAIALTAASISALALAPVAPGGFMKPDNSLMPAYVDPTPEPSIANDQTDRSGANEDKTLNKTLIAKTSEIVIAPPPTPAETKTINALLKKSGWKTPPIFVTNPTNNSTDDVLGKVYSSLSKKARLPGTVATKAFVGETKTPVKGYNFSYVSEFNVFTDTRQLVSGAYIRVYPVSTDYQFNIDFPITASQSQITSAVTTYYRNNLFTTKETLYKLDMPQGVKTNQANQKVLNNIFSKKGWQLSNAPFYLNVPDQGSDGSVVPYLSEYDVPQVITAALGKETPEASMPSSGYYFAQKTYTIPGTSDKFYVEFNAFASLNVSKPEYVWILVKPALTNMDGKFDHYYYSANTKLSQIQKEMKDHFAGARAPLPPGAVN